MKTKALVLKNKDGKVIRFLSTTEDKLCVAVEKETHRLHLIAESQITDDENLMKVTSFTAQQVEKSDVKISDHLTIASYDTNLPIKSEVQPRKEDEDRLPVFMKYSAAGHVAGILLVILLSWIINKYFNKDAEPIVVQVFQQERIQKPRQVVQASQKKIRPKKVRKARVSNRTKVAKSTRSARKKSNRNARAAAQNVASMGALGVLGGFSKNMNGAGGLNVKATKNNAGVGYGGAAAKGGHSRGLVGKGLVAAGAGNGGTVKGYGGYGTEGKGGGKPGYGSRRLGGSSSGALYALSDEALIEGGLDMDQINAVVRRHRGQLVQCYERALQKSRSLAGRVDVNFVIGGSGKVSTAAVANTSLGARSVESCLIQKLRGWKFPQPVGSVSVRVSYPFVFDRNG